MFHVTVTHQACSSKDSVQVNTMAIPVVNLLGDRHLCDGETLYLDAGNPGNQYLWSTGDTTQSISLTLPGEYWVRVGYFPCYNYDTVNVDLITLAVELGPDTLLCPGGNITLDAGNPGSNYLWNTGNTYQTLNISRNGTFWVRVYQYQCQVSDTVHVDMMEELVMPSVLNLCGHESLTLEAGIVADNYLWNTGETSPSIVVTEAGNYSLVATMGHCNLEDSTEVIGKSGISTFYIPNSFTPNGDGLNETFSAQGIDVTFFKMTIFNRWGELLYETSDREKGWDGKFQGEYVPGGEYVYVIQYANTCSFDQVFQKKGTVAVVR
jgi:gliding motility-associated-like protein